MIANGLARAALERVRKADAAAFAQRLDTLKDLYAIQ
jgi:hypothetical protein